MGTDLYQRAMAYDYGDAERQEIMHKVWDACPFLIDVYTGPIQSIREREIYEWCRDEMGPEAWNLADRPGNWQRGTATVHGWTWYGFATAELMRQFLDHWPQPDHPLN